VSATFYHINAGFRYAYLVISVFSLVLAAMASMRLTRLATTDSITEQARVWIVAKANKDWVETLLTCPWCIGFWISGIVTSVTWFWHNQFWLLGLTILTVSQLVGLFSRLDKGYD